MALDLTERQVRIFRSKSITIATRVPIQVVIQTSAKKLMATYCESSFETRDDLWCASFLTFMHLWMNKIANVFAKQREGTGFKISILKAKVFEN